MAARLQEEDTGVDQKTEHHKEQGSGHQSTWGPKLFLWTAAGLVLFFWWLLIYSGGVVLHH